MTGMEADYFSDPYDVIEAESKEEACSIYNKKHKCDYFCGKVMAEIHEDRITDLDEYARLVDVERAISETAKAMQKHAETSNQLFECSGACTVGDLLKAKPKFTRICGYLLKGQTFSKQEIPARNT
jgi:predicted YcjX-like family ATPase